MTESNSQSLTARLEALLFIHGEPMAFKKLASLTGASVSDVEAAVAALQMHYESDERGITLVKAGDTVGLVTKSDFSGFLQSFIKEEFEENLSPASLETLTLIAYLGPIPRSRVDFYRGVNSSFTVRSLLLRGLIERIPEPDRNGHFLYQPSFELLKYLGVRTAAELPGYADFKNELEKQAENPNPNPES